MSANDPVEAIGATIGFVLLIFALAWLGEWQERRARRKVKRCGKHRRKA
ncbi:hypothetical protein [Nonomuraea sp. CA-141351]